MSTPTNNIVRSVAPRSVFPDASSVISSAVSFNQGDFIIFNDTSNLLQVPTTEASCSTFLGVATVSIINGKLITALTGVPDAVTTVGLSNVPGPSYGVVVRCIAKTGDAFAPGDSVFFDPATGTSGVTTTGTKAIGIYQGAVISSAAAGQTVDCLLMARFPGDAIKGA